MDAEGLKEGIGCMPMDGTCRRVLLRSTRRNEEKTDTAATSIGERVQEDDLCVGSGRKIRVSDRFEVNEVDVGRPINEERRIRVSDQVGVCRRDEKRRRRPRLQISQQQQENKQIPACVADAGMCCR